MQKIETGPISPKLRFTRNSAFLSHPIPIPCQLWAIANHFASSYRGGEWILFTALTLMMRNLYSSSLKMSVGGSQVGRKILRSPNTFLHGTGSEQPPGMPCELKRTHSFLYICLFKEVITVSFCTFVLRSSEISREFSKWAQVYN